MQYPVEQKNGKKEERRDVIKWTKKNRDPKSAATSNFILIVVVMVTLTKAFRGYFQITSKLF